MNKNSGNNSSNSSEAGLLSFRSSLIKIIADNLIVSLILMLLIWMIFPIVYFCWKYLEIKGTKYNLTDERIIARTGIMWIKEDIDYLELYRIRDIKLKRGCFYHFVDFFMVYLKQKPLLLADIQLFSSDASHSTLFINTVPNALGISERIRAAVNQDKTTKKMMRCD